MRGHTALALQGTSQSSFLSFSAYSKIVTLGKDEFHLQLVDAAGQVLVWGRYLLINVAVQFWEMKSSSLCGSAVKQY